MEYILFLAQEANFQTRSILIPKKEFLSNPFWKKRYNTLKNHSQSALIKYDNQDDVLVDNLLFQEWTKNTIGLNQKKHPYTSICNDLIYYAHDYMEGYLKHKDDLEWFDKSITDFVRGFDHVQNYNHFKNKKIIQGKQVQIVESFLVLDKVATDEYTF
jgi:hypothetical protein